ncbi:MAG TPA: alkaline phytoceramidase [candidate division Zixibacteria bacterium]|nr:alkaline phytoceramidase [candidate division Zixibacteria bacterium]
MTVRRGAGRWLPGLLVALAAVGVAGLWFVPRVPQPQWYHEFADRRTLLGIPNFWNVASNLPLALAGAWGLWRCGSARSLPGLRHAPARWMYAFFFGAVALAGAGSFYYHWQPDNERLVWDRLPIALATMSLLAIVIAEWIDHRAGSRLFLPLLLLGAGTVVYWHLTERWGAGDLRPYLLSQLYAAIAIPLTLLSRPAAYSHGEKLYGALGWYVAARLFELFDARIYAAGEIASGHTLKHLAAAASACMIYSWLRSRRPSGLSFGDR